MNSFSHLLSQGTRALGNSRHMHRGEQARGSTASRLGPLGLQMLATSRSRDWREGWVVWWPLLPVLSYNKLLLRTVQSSGATLSRARQRGNQSLRRCCLAEQSPNAPRSSTLSLLSLAPTLLKWHLLLQQSTSVRPRFPQQSSNPGLLPSPSELCPGMSLFSLPLPSPGTLTWPRW